MSLWSGLPKSVRQALRWDAASGLLTGLFSGAVFPFLGVIARGELHASVYLIALLNAAASVGNLFSPLMAHYIRDRAKLPYVIWPFAVGRFFFVLMPLALVAPAYVTIGFLAAAVSSLGAPAYAAVIRDAYPGVRRGQLMGLVRVMVVVGFMVGSLVGGFALGKVSYRWVFPAAALIGMLGIAAFSRVGVLSPPAPPTPAGRSLWDGFRLMKSDRAFRLYAMCFYLYGLGNLIMGPVIPVFQVDVLKITPQWVGYLGTAGAAFSMVGYLVWGRVLDRHGPFRLLLLVIGVLALSPTTYFLAHRVPTLLVAAAASGFAMAGGDLAYVNAAMRFGPRDAAVAYAGMFAFLQACRGMPGPFIGAALSNVVGPRYVFLAALGLWTVSVTILLAGGGLRERR